MALCVMCACGGKGEKAESQTKEEAKTLSGLKPSDFVSEVDGKPTALYVLKNSQGAEACVTNWGGRLVSVMVPDRDGKLTDVVLGYDNIQQYVQFPDNNYGALIGRYGNRIANGQFQLDGQSYQLPQNNNGHCLHGGPKGYHAVTWDARQLDGQSVELTYLSPDGEAGFPGNLKVKVIYRLTDDNAIDIQYEATTDKPTIVNLTIYAVPFLAQGPLRFAACGLDGIWEWGTPWFDWSYGTYLLVLVGLLLALSLGATGLTVFLSQYSGSYIAMLLKAVPLFVAVGAVLGTWLLDMPFTFRNLGNGAVWLPRGIEAVTAGVLLALGLSRCILSCRQQKRRELL